MTEKRFIEFATQNTDNGEINNGFQDIKTGEWYYTKDSENAKKICELLNELYLWKIRYNALKEAHFTKMGGFSMERDGRGRYNILSENIIPKNSPVIQIKSPDAVWNSIVADIFNDLLTEEG